MAAARSIDWIGLGTTDYCRNENVKSVSRLARFGRHDAALAGWVGVDGVPIPRSSVFVRQETQVQRLRDYKQTGRPPTKRGGVHAVSAS